jgi:integrase
MAHKVVLCWRAKTPRGWRHFPVLFETQHGKNVPRHGWVLDGGREVEYPEGRYELRTYSAGKMVYTPLEATHPAEAKWALQRAQREAQTKRTQKADPLHFISAAVEAYLRDLDARKKPEMREKAAHVLNEFRFFCSDETERAQSRLPICLHTRRVTREHVLGFHAYLRKRGNSERTIADKHARVLAWLKFCKVDTSWFPPAPKFEKTLPTVYEQTQITDLRAAAGDEMRLAIDLLWMLGLREREATHAEWADIDWTHNVFRVQGKVRKHYRFSVKDSEQREVPIPAALLSRLKAWREEHSDTRLILSGKNDRPEGHLLRKLKALARNNGLNCTRCEGCQRPGALAECEEFELHRFRRTYATTLLRSGVDLATAQRMMGHSDLASTMRYLRPASSEHVQDKVNQIFGD